MAVATTVKTHAVPEVLVRRVQDEFREMPGLRLTQPQACRLWGVDRTQRSTAGQAADLFTRL